MAQNPQNSPDGLDDDDFTALAGKKVALDLDDAPFLQEEEPKPQPEKEPAPKTEPEADEAEPQGGKKKLIIIIAAAAVLLLGIGAAVYFLFLREPAEPEPERPIIVVPTEVQHPTTPQLFQVKLEPFVVQLLDADGNRHFLEASFVIVTDNGMLFLELEDKTVTIRDSVYYYLHNQTYEYLRNPANTESIKASLIRAINDYLLTAEIQDIYFDSFLIR